MKNLFKEGKLWVGLSVLLVMLSVGFLAYAAGGTTNPCEGNPLGVFCQFKVQEKLTKEVRDGLMDKLDDLFYIDPVGSVTIQYEIIPSGAIMAFNLTGGCPDGWHDFPEAQGRFLMGTAVTGYVGQTGGGGNAGGVNPGENKILLNMSDIPPHRHYMFGPYTDPGVNLNSQADHLDDDEDWDDWNEDGVINVYDLDTSTRNYYVAFYSDHNGDEEYQLRGYDYLRGTDGNRNGDATTWGAVEPMKGLTSWGKDLQRERNGIDITNQYIKVRYCIKD